MAIADAMKESMSAVIDGEGSELDIARVLKAVDEDPEARAHWQRIQQTRSLLCVLGRSSARSMSVKLSVNPWKANPGGGL